jgi:hypothetical protein
MNFIRDLEIRGKEKKKKILFSIFFFTPLLAFEKKQANHCVSEAKITW